LEVLQTLDQISRGGVSVQRTRPDTRLTFIGALQLQRKVFPSEKPFKEKPHVEIVDDKQTQHKTQKYIRMVAQLGRTEDGNTS